MQHTVGIPVDERLREAERKLDAVLDNASVAIFLMDERQHCSYMNSAAERLTGYTFAETQGRPLHDVIHHTRPDGSHFPLAECAIDRAFPENANTRGEEVFVHKNGHFYPVAFTASPIRDDTANIVGTIIEVRDISAERAANAELADQARMLETLNRTGAAIASELDLERLVQTVTDAGVELTGAHFGAFFYNVLNDAGESYTLYTLSGVDRSEFERFPMPRNTAVFAPTFKGDGIVRSNDILADPRYGKNAPYRGMPDGHLPVRSYLAVPVTSRSGEVIGGLFFGHPEPDRFSQRHEHLMVGIAAEAAIAMDNARLYRAAQREIEERRQAEAALRHTEAALREAGERIQLALDAGAIVGTWVWNIREDRLTADERFAHTFGVSPELCRTGLPLSQLTSSIHPEDWPGVERLLQEAIAKGSSYRAEYRVRQEDGFYKWIEASGRCEHDGDGNAIRFPGVLIDTDERRRMEEQLRDKEADLSLLLNATADGFYAVNKEGTTTRCNAAFLRMLGIPSEGEVIGRKLHAVIHHSHPDGTHYPVESCPIYRTASTGEPAHVVGELFFRFDGSSFPVEYWVRPVLRDGELQGAVCNFIDISERKQAEEARQLLLRELNHRVKNLFSIASGMVNMTARTAKNTDEMARALSGRLLALARAHELIRSAITPDAHPAKTARLLELVSAVVAPHVSGRDQLHIDGPDIEIGPTAATSLALVLHELGTNAAKYGSLSAAEGRLDVSWRATLDGLVLTWTESGGPRIENLPTRTGFGSQLARMSAGGQLGGEISFDWKPAGACIVLRAAAERLAQ